LTIKFTNFGQNWSFDINLKVIIETYKSYFEVINIPLSLGKSNYKILALN